ncbi:MAG: N(4)-(beta-N-acetylglucosaminyl)-L-asparaginase [bacterium]|nr:N(4)-(beta-N-acetylglucosaminyl)-L-asparaginase [bacterium]
MAVSLDRRTFLKTAAAAAAGGALTASSAASQAGRSEQPAEPGSGGPVVVSSGNGLPAAAKAMEMIQAGADPLDAVVAGVNIVERDPTDHSVGYGGLPNEDGVVELDSCVMHGPTHNAGAVAGLHNIKTPSSVAKLVMERTDHVLLVGEGALRFARAHGFEEVNLLTDDARRAWLKWKERRQDNDWLPPPGGDAKEDDKQASRWSRDHEFSMNPDDIQFTYGTINCVALDKRSNLAGVTTTSGLSYKIPGRVGDSPIIGAGLYVDNEVGAAGATGRGEAVILNCGSFSIVEKMRAGKAPTEACLEVLGRIADHVKDPRLRKPDGRPDFGVTFYALRKDGLFGSASMWSGAQFTVHAGGRNRKEDCAFLYERRK